MLIHNADITGSLTINGIPYNTGSFTGSFFGDGSQLSGVTSYTNADTLAFINSIEVVSGSIETRSTVSDTFTSVTSYTVTHNFNTKEVIVSVYENDTVIFPSSITTPTVNTVTITFPEPVTGRVVVVKAGHIVSGSIDYSNVLNKPTLVSGSSQVTYSGLTGIPSGIVSGSEQVTYSGLTGIPSGIVSGSAQISEFGIFATTGSNGFNGSQSITGSLTVTGQVVAQTLNVQQVTSSIVFSSGSNIFGNSLANTQQFTGSLQVSGSSHYLLGNVGIGTTGMSEKLTVDGNILLGGDYNLAIDVTTNGNGKVGRTDRAYLQINRSNFEGFLSFHTTSTGAGGLSERLRITSTGNVGIGTTSPNAILHLEQSVDGNMPIKFRNSFGATSNTNSTVDILSELVSSANAGQIGSRIRTGKDGDYSSGATRDAYLSFATAENDALYERMRITSGGNVLIGTTTDGGGKLEIRTSTYNRIASYFSGDYTSGFKFSDLNGGIYYDAANDYLNVFTDYVNGKIAFSTAGSERMRITSGGNVGIGTTSPNGNLQFASSTNTRKIVLFEGGNNNFQFYGFGVENSTLVYSTYTTSDDHVFFAGIDTTTRKESVRIHGDGGISFNGDTAAANVLDDYEEGTWTPDIVFGSWSFGARSGFFTKIGNLVTANLLIVWSANNSPSGDSFRITLPFTAFGSGNFRAPASIGYTAGVNFNTSRQLVAHVDMGQNYVSFQQLVSGGNPTGLTTGEISSTGEIQISVTYQV